MNVAVASASEKAKVASALSDGSAGSDVRDGDGGGVPSTATTGAWPCSSNSVVSWNSVVVQVYVPSVSGAVAATLIVSVAPGQSSELGSAGAAASIVPSTLRTAVHVAAEIGRASCRERV